MRPIHLTRSPEVFTPPDNLTLLRSNPYWEVLLEPWSRIVVLRRLAVKVTSFSDLTSENAPVVLQLQAVQPREGIVVDVREAPLPTDGVDDAMQPLRDATYRLFSRVAVLFKTQVGVLHLKRLGHPATTQVLATTNEADAFAFARG